MNQGGSYRVKKHSKEVALLERTADHPEGNRPRDAIGGQKAEDGRQIKPKPKRRVKPKPIVTDTTKE